jgi:PAS domain S-box-containing protein
MNVFVDYDANLPTQMWIVARCIQAASFVIAPLIITRRINEKTVFTTYFILTASLIILIFSGYFPDCYIEGSGLTSFKIIGEYIICLILFIAIYLLFKKKNHFSREVLLLLYGALLTTILSELAFTAYISVYGPANYLGHLLKIIAFAFIYQAIVVTGLRKPFDTMFRTLSQSEAKYRTFFNNMDEGVAVFDLVEHGGIIDYQFVDVNRRYASMMGMRPGDIIGKKGTEIYGKDTTPPHLQYFQSVLNTKESLRFSAVHKPDMKHYAVSVFFIEEKRLATVVTDVTALKISEEALIRANKKLKLLSQVTRHDINNDLSLAYASIDLIQSKIPVNPETDEYFGYLRSSIDAINSKVDFTRNYEQMGTQKPFWQSLSRIIAEIRKSNPRFSGIDFHDSLDSLEIFADLMLPKVFANLVDNSIRHGKKVSAIYISYQITKDGCRIIYEDDGIGIGKEIKHKIFEPDYSKTHGFGLFLIREILQLTGIEFTEEGEEGKGAKFVFLVPEGGFRQEKKTIEI